MLYAVICYKLLRVIPNRIKRELCLRSLHTSLVSSTIIDISIRSFWRFLILFMSFFSSTIDILFSVQPRTPSVCTTATYFINHFCHSFIKPKTVRFQIFTQFKGIGYRRSNLVNIAFRKYVNSV